MKTLLITGAGKGIGLSTARLAAQAGHRVLAISRNIKALKEIDGIEAYSVDLANENEITDFANALTNTTIDVLINNAGLLTNTSVEGSDFYPI